MSQRTWTAVDRYLDDLLVGHDAALEAALKASPDAGLPAINVSATQGKLLNLLARALPAEGRLVTLEIDRKHADVARANLERADLHRRVEVRVGAALESLSQLGAEAAGPFDLFFIDADKPNIPSYFKWALRLSRPGSVIVVDNVVREGAVIDAESADASVQGVRKLNELMASEPRVSATTIQTVGVKGYDGFAVALVTGD